jgi:hypothetical protein
MLNTVEAGPIADATDHIEFTAVLVGRASWNTRRGKAGFTIQAIAFPLAIDAVSQRVRADFVEWAILAAATRGDSDACRLAANLALCAVRAIAAVDAHAARKVAHLAFVAAVLAACAIGG